MRDFIPDLPADQLEAVKQSMKEVDMAQRYIDSANELVRNGDHAEVIRILTADAMRPESTR